MRFGSQNATKTLVFTNFHLQSTFRIYHFSCWVLHQIRSNLDMSSLKIFSMPGGSCFFSNLSQFGAKLRKKKRKSWNYLKKAKVAYVHPSCAPVGAAWSLFLLKNEKHFLRVEEIQRTLKFVGSGKYVLEDRVPFSVLFFFSSVASITQTRMVRIKFRVTEFFGVGLLANFIFVVFRRCSFSKWRKNLTRKLDSRLNDFCKHTFCCQHSVITFSAHH